MSTNFFSAPSRGTRAQREPHRGCWALLIAAFDLLTLHSAPTRRD